jgi:hypothetical protein
MKKLFSAITVSIVFSIAGFSNAFAATTVIPKLFLSADGLGLSSFPSRNSLTETINVRRTDAGPPAAWTAVSDQPWLTVTSGGITEGPLTVEANPAGLEKDRTYTAKVTVSTNGGDFTDHETLYVGFWIGSQDPVKVNVAQTAVTGIVANPVEPFVYTTDGSGSIYKYNFYSGKLVGTITTVAPTLGVLEVSSDGRIIFAADTTNQRVLELRRDGTQIGSISLSGPVYQNMVYARPYGIPALFVTNNSVFAVPSGKVLASGVPGNYIAVPPNGRSLFGVDVGVSPGTLYNYSLVPTKGQFELDLNNALFMDNPVSSNCQDLAVSRSGERVYPACGAPYEFDVYDGKTLNYVKKYNGIPYPNNVEVDVNGDLIGGVDGEIFVYNKTGLKGKFIANESMQPADIKVSDDATRIVVVSGYSYLGSQELSFYNSP